MLKVYNDPELEIDETTFERPKELSSIELDCRKYNYENYLRNTNEVDSSANRPNDVPVLMDADDIEF
jgi:hypothetical protein